VADILFHRTVPGLVDGLPAELRRAVDAVESAPTSTLLRLTEEAVRKWHGTAGGRIHVSVAPTIPGQCTDELLVGCQRLAQEYGVAIHTHLAETKIQAIHALQRWGETLVAHLASFGLLGPRFVGAHGIWLADDDISRLADAGASVVHNPTSNLRLGSGLAPVREMLDRGLTVGLGTDGSVCSDNQNLFEAMRFAALVGTVRFPHAPASWIDGQTAWQMATSGSARVMGLADEIGRVAPGYQADLLLLRADSAYLRPLSHVVNNLVYAETGSAVDTVLVGGRIVVRSVKVLTVDEDKLHARAQEAADRLRARNKSAWVLAANLRPYLTAACQASVVTPYPINRYAVPLLGEK
jgi:5-methylthioadenosine/S-adenosylhomocysteine deaminase